MTKSSIAQPVQPAEAVDAARYRWLKKNSNYILMMVLDEYEDCDFHLTEANADEVIDNAMEYPK